jgi:uncharacterized iron-regulated membrane protein
MKRLRALLFWSHLAAGLTAGVVIFVMSFTGAALALRPQIQNWVDRDIRSVASHGAPKLTTHQLLMSVKQARPDASPQSVSWDADPEVAVTVGLGREGNVYVDPYTGGVLGSPSAATSQFFQSMTSWHRYMGAGGDARATGRAATGAANLVFLLLGVSGLYLWWPRALTVRYLKPIVWFRQTATGRARDFNWHNTIGFWCLPAIIVMTLSGVVMSYQWGNNLVYRLTGSPLPAGRGGGPGEGAERGGSPGAEGRGGRAGQQAAVGREAQGRREGQVRGEGQTRGEQTVIIPDTLDALVARAAQQVPTWSQLSLRLPNRDGAPVSFTITDGAQWNRFARSQLTLQAATGDITAWQPYDAQSPGQKARGWLRFAHTGELGGIVGQILAGLGCLGGVFLVYTGFSLATRRLWNWSLWTRTTSTRRAGPVTARNTDRGVPVSVSPLNESGR